MRKCVLIVMLLVLAGELQAQQSATTRPTTVPAKGELSPAVTAFLKPMEAATGDDPVRAKLKERHNTAVRLLELRVEGYRRGVSGVSEVFESARLVGEAKLDLAQQLKERDQIMEQILEVSQTIESRLKMQFDRGVVSEADVLRARLARETMEVELLKLRRSGVVPTTPTTQPR